MYHEPQKPGGHGAGLAEEWRGDGIIVRVQSQHIAEAVQRTGLPVVDVLGVAPDSRIPLVHVNNALIGRAVAEHLWSAAAAVRLLRVCGDELGHGAAAAFEAAISAAGCSCRFFREPLHTRSDSSWETQQERLAAWIQRLPKPVGIMACYDPVGQKILEACRAPSWPCRIRWPWWE